MADRHAHQATQLHQLVGVWSLVVVECEQGGAAQARPPRAFAPFARTGIGIVEIVDVRFDRVAGHGLAQRQSVADVGEEIAFKTAQGPSHVRVVREARQTLRIGRERMRRRVAARTEA